MRNLRIFLGIPGLILLLVCMNGCQRSSVAGTPETEIAVLLAENVPGEYLLTKYGDIYHLHDLRRISRAENKWSFCWSLREKKMKKALSKLNDDPNILSVEELTNEVAPPANSTNSGHSKTKPIKNP